MQLKKKKKYKILNFKKHSIYKKLIGIMNKKGKKWKVKKNLNLGLSETSFILKKNYNKLQKKFITESKIPIEVKKIVKRKVESFVPFKIKKKRRIYFILKLFTEIIFNDNQKIKISHKIFNEFKNIVEINDKSKLLNKKNEILESALQNRTNIHFRW
jgi:hypothetical protein